MKLKRFLYLPDPHGHHVNEKAWNVVKQFYEDYAPDEVVYGGDVFDLSPIRKGASAEEKAQSMEPDFEAGMRLFREVPPTRFILGNHDYRAWDQAEHGSGPVADFCAYLTRQVEGWARKNHVKMYPYRADSYCRMNNRLKMVHGCFANMHTAKALAHFGGEVGCVIGGHTHSIDYYQVQSMTGIQEAYTVGCLHEIYQPYCETRPNTTRHRHGFAFGEYEEGGNIYNVQVAKKDEDGFWRIPTGIKEYV